MKTYSIDPLQRSKLVRALELRLTATFGAVFVVVVFIAVLLLPRADVANPWLSVLAMGGAIVVLAALIGYRLLRQVRAYERALKMLQFDLADDHIMRRQPLAGQPHAVDLRIPRADVTSLKETEAGLLILTRDPNLFMWLPAQLGNFAEARAALATWKRIQTTPPSQASRNTSLISTAWGISTALCLGVLLFARDPWQIAAAGLAALAIYLYVFRLLRSQIRGDMRFRRMFSGILIFLIVVVAIKLLMTLAPALGR
jgi:hypothetical protein